MSVGEEVVREIAYQWWVEAGRCRETYGCSELMSEWNSYVVVPNTIARVLNSVVENLHVEEVKAGDNGAVVKGRLDIDYDNKFTVRVRKSFDNKNAVDIMISFRVRGESVLSLDSDVAEEAVSEFEKEHNWQREFSVHLTDNLKVQIWVWEETEEVDEHVITWDGFDVYISGVREEIAPEVGAAVLALGLFYFAVESFL